LWARSNSPTADPTNFFPTNSFRVDTIPISNSLVSSLPIGSNLVSSNPVSSNPVGSRQPSSAGSGQGQQGGCRDEWARRQGAADFAESLLSIASSHTPEVFRCLSELIFSTLDQPDVLRRFQNLNTQNVFTEQEPSLPARPSAAEPAQAPSKAPSKASAQTLSKTSGKSQIQPHDTGARQRLSASEKRVAELVSQGLSLRAVGERLYISAKTADFHLQSVYRKLDVHNRGEFANAFFHLQNAA
jgi:DNA-binding CsgD family transcriptional regulator